MNADGVFVRINGSTIGCLTRRLFLPEKKNTDAFTKSFSVQPHYQ